MSQGINDTLQQFILQSVKNDEKGVEVNVVQGSRCLWRAGKA